MKGRALQIIAVLLAMPLLAGLYYVYYGIAEDAAAVITAKTSVDEQTSAATDPPNPGETTTNEPAADLLSLSLAQRPPKFGLLMSLVSEERHIPPDLIEAVLEGPELEAYVELWSKATVKFSNRSNAEAIAQSIKRILEARAYFPDISVNQSLEYLLDTNKVDARIAAEEKYKWLESEYYRPIIEAENARIAEQQAIDEYRAAVADSIEVNRQAAQSRGQARNSTRVERAQSQTLDIESRRAPQIQQDEQARRAANDRIRNR